jgi:hypothetical protein
MTPYEQGRKGYEEFQGMAVNPFDFSYWREWDAWADFEKGWQDAMAANNGIENDTV